MSASPVALRDDPPLRGVPGPPQRLGTNTAVSPDGRWIAFGFYRAVYSTNNQVWWSGIGMLDTATGALRRVTTTDGRAYTRPVFHPDGAHLFCLWGRAGRSTRGVCRIDLTTGEERDLYGLDSPLPDPPIDSISGFGVAPDGKRLLVSRFDGVVLRLHDLRLVEFERNRVSAALPAQEGARYFGDIYFQNDIKIILTAGSGTGFGTALKGEIAAHGLDSIDSVVCRLRLGDLPRLLVPELERHPAFPNDIGGLRRIGLARDGTLVATAHRGRPGPGVSGQIARVDIDRQRLEYLTSVPGLKDGVSIAANGSVIAFLSSEVLRTSSPDDLWSLDRRSGAVVKHAMLPRLQADQRFFLP